MLKVNLEVKIRAWESPRDWTCDLATSLSYWNMVLFNVRSVKSKIRFVVQRVWSVEVLQINVEFLKLFKIFTSSICVILQLRLIFGISFFLMPPKCKSSHSFYVFLLSHHISQASIQRISRSHTFHSPCLSDEGGNSFGCIIRPRNSISYIYRRCLSHGTKGSCQVLIEDMMVVRIFKLEF